MANVDPDYIYVTLRDETVTGGKNQVIEQLRRKISGLTRSDQKLREIYIGIGSGMDYVHALWRRYDDYKREAGVNEMIAVYTSSSQQNCRDVERELVEHYQKIMAKKGQRDVINRRAGGGGRPSSQPHHFVYLAMRRLG